MSPFQYLSFYMFIKVTLPNIRKSLVNVSFPSPLQYLNGSLSKYLSSVYFHAVQIMLRSSTARSTSLRTVDHQHMF